MLTNLRDVYIGQSRSSNIVPFHILGIVSYCAIVTLSLSVIRQLKHTGLCLPPKRQQRRGGPDLCWQTVPRVWWLTQSNAVDRSSRVSITGFRNPALIKSPTGLWEWPSPSNDALYTPTEGREADHCPWGISEAACWPVVPAASRWRTG